MVFLVVFWVVWVDLCFFLRLLRDFFLVIWGFDLREGWDLDFSRWKGLFGAGRGLVSFLQLVMLGWADRIVEYMPGVFFSEAFN